MQWNASPCVILEEGTSCTHANSVVFAHASPQLTLCIPALRPKRNTFSHLHLHMHTFGNIFGNTTLRSNRYCIFNTSCFFHVHTLALILPVLVGGCAKSVFLSVEEMTRSLDKYNSTLNGQSAFRLFTPSHQDKDRRHEWRWGITHSPVLSLTFTLPLFNNTSLC